MPFLRRLKRNLGFKNDLHDLFNHQVTPPYIAVVEPANYFKTSVFMKPSKVRGGNK